MPQPPFVADPQRDLVLERVVPISVEALWRGYTDPNVLMQWFCPAPWKVVAAELDPRPGGIFKTVFQSPEGQQFPNTGCYLELDAPHLLVWTGALLPGYRPRTTMELKEVPFLFTARLEFTPHPDGAVYRAVAIHSDADGRNTHDKMGFHAGWGAALDQLVSLTQAEKP